MSKRYIKQHDQSTGRQRFFLSPMEAEPLTPARDEGSARNQRQFQPQQRQRQNNASGWSSSMALFSYSDSNRDAHFDASTNPMTTIPSASTSPVLAPSPQQQQPQQQPSLLSLSSPPPPNLSESSFRQSRNYSAYGNTPFRETSTDRTTVQPKPYHPQHDTYARPQPPQPPQRPQPYQPDYRRPPSLNTASTTTPSVSQQSNRNMHAHNPWLPPVESLTTPSSVATSTSGSTFVFGQQRRPSLRSEISKLDSAASPSHLSIQSNTFLAADRLLGTSLLDEEDDSEDDADDHHDDHNYDDFIHTNGDVEVTLDDVSLQDGLDLSYDEEHAQLQSHIRYSHEHRTSQQDQTMEQQDQPRLRQTLEEMTRQASNDLARIGEITGHGLIRVGGIAGSELQHMTRYAMTAATSATARVLRRPMQTNNNPLSPIMEPQWQDLYELQETHQAKMDRLKPSHVQDHYDFALVLTPQMSYSFWAELLDFRAEQLGELLTSVPSSNDGTIESQDDDEEDNNKENEDNNHATTTIDAKLFSTPQTGIRRRHNSITISTSPPADNVEPYTPVSSAYRKHHDVTTSDRKLQWSAGILDSDTKTVKPRLSLFEKAIAVFSPNASRVSFGGFSASRLGVDVSNTPSTHGGYDSGIVSTRRRWGNRPDLTTPPLASFRSRKRRSTTVRRSSSDQEEFLDEINDQEEQGKVLKRRKLLSDEQIPSQVVPRGIAARSNGLVQFISALKRGIVVRRHRPGSVAAFVRLYSHDGGDTIKMEPVSKEEAMLAFREQRVRFNRKMAKRRPGFQVQSQRWAHIEEDAQAQNFEIPDHIAAEQYRKKLFDKHRDLKAVAVDAATRLKNSGSIRIQDVIDVHPGRHEDPRVKGELGTAHLRRSKSEYDSNYSFSIVQKSKRVASSIRNNANAAERWRSGEGNAAQFKTVDFEAASEGEYWLVFRGFLLLHRDAARGRFASNRMAGFGSNYREELASDLDHNRLQVDTFHEPKTFTWFERRVAAVRKIDITLESNGSAEPGAVPPPSDYFLGFKSPGTQIWSRLRQAGLETARIYAIDPQKVMIKVRCPVDRLTDVAEVLRIKLKKRDGNFAFFRESNLGIFAPLHDDLDAPGVTSLFRSCHRQKVIDFIIRSRIRDSGAELGQNTELGHMIQVRVPLHMTKKLESLYRVWFYFYQAPNWGHRDGRSMTVSPTDPLGNDLDQDHRPRGDPAMPNPFARFFVGAFYQPLDSIEQYFGEQVTFYFAWLQHCSHHLTFLSVLGCIVSIFQYTSNTWDHPIRPFFSVVVMIWSFYVLVKWRQRSSFLAHRWGTMDHKEQETTRPQFKGEYRQDEITGEWVVFYPPWKRYVKYVISFPITVAFTTGTLILILLVHANRDLMLAQYVDPNHESEEFQFDFRISAIGAVKPIRSVEMNSENLSDPQFWYIIAGLPSLLGLFLPLLNFILMRISVLLNDFENYRTESHYRTALIVKVFSFRFVCYFATLYYYAFLSVGDAQAIENGILRVGSSVFIYITVAHYWGLFLQINFPILIYQICRRRQKKRLHDELMQVEREEQELRDHDEQYESADCSAEEMEQKKIRLINKRLLLDQAQDDLWRETMLPEHDSFPEYIQAVVQFAYVTCFSVVLPITPLICLMNHLISMRLDAYKLCQTRRRPLAQTTGGIGVWEHVLHIVSVIAILTNCWLMGFTNAQLYSLSTSVSDIGLFAIVVVWEHVMLLIKYVMQASSHKLPKSVRDEMAKELYEQERKRNSSMRQKKDRQYHQHQSSTSHMRNEDDSTSSGAGSVLDRTTSTESKSSNMKRSITDDAGTVPTSKNVMHRFVGGSKGVGRHGLMTIPSEDISDCSTVSSARQLEAMQVPQTADSTKTQFPHRNNNLVYQNHEERHDAISKESPLETSFEEDNTLNMSRLQPQNMMNTGQFSPAVSSIQRASLATTEDESPQTTTTTTSVATVPSNLFRMNPSRWSNESHPTNSSTMTSTSHCSVATVPSKVNHAPQRSTINSRVDHTHHHQQQDAMSLASVRFASHRLAAAAAAAPKSSFRRFPSTPEGDLHEA